MNNSPINPIFAKFDAALGKTTPTTANSPVQSRAEEIRNLAKESQPKEDGGLIGMIADNPLVQDTAKKVNNTINDTISSVKNDLTQNTKELDSAVRNEKGEISPLKAALGLPAFAGKGVLDVGEGIAKAGWGAVGDIVSSIIPQHVKEVYSEETNKFLSDLKSAWEAPGTTPEEQKGRQIVHDFVDTSAKVVNDHPEVIKPLMKGINLVLSGMGAEGGVASLENSTAKTLEQLSSLTQKVKSSISDLVPAATEDLTKGIVKESVKITPEKARASAWEDIKPKDTPSTKLAYAKEGNVTEQGLFKKGDLKPSQADSKLIDTHAKLYEDGTLNNDMSPGEKQTAINQKAAQLNGDQNNFLKENDKAVTLSNRHGEGVFDKLDSVAKESTLPFGRDVSAKGAYDSAIDVFKSKLDIGKSAGATQGATTLSKLSEALTSFDKAMDSFGAYKKSATGEITETALARQNAIRDIHKTVRDFISDNLPANSPWKSIRAEESNLYEISDRLSQRIADTVGNNKVTQTIKKHPIIKTGVKAAGFGAGLHLAIP